MLAKKKKKYTWFSIYQSQGVDMSDQEQGFNPEQNSNKSRLRDGEPNTYVTDPAKAEAMARSSKNQEDKVREHAKNIENLAFDDSAFRNGQLEFEEGKAKKARLQADKIAENRGRFMTSLENFWVISPENSRSRRRLVSYSLF